MDNPKIFHYFVTDWEKHQSYHRLSKNYSKAMQWLKLPFLEIVNETDMMDWSDEEIVFLTYYIRGVASQYKGRLPSPEIICRRMGRVKEVGRVKELLEHFLKLGYIIEYNPNIDDVFKEEIALEKYMRLEGKSRSQCLSVGVEKLTKTLKSVYKEHFSHIQDWRNEDVDALLRENFTDGMDEVDTDTGEVLVAPSSNDTIEQDAYWERQGIHHASHVELKIDRLNSKTDQQDLIDYATRKGFAKDRIQDLANRLNLTYIPF